MPIFRDARWFSKAGILFLFFVLCVIPACCFSPRIQTPDPFSVTSDSSLIETVPFFNQESGQCGPASLAMVLQGSGVAVDPETLAPQVYVPEKQGSLQPLLISTARHYERLPYPIKGMEALFAELSAGHPVLVLQNLGLSWFPQWHYAVALGYDQRTDQVILHSGRTAGKRVPRKLFIRTWRRADYWGLVILPPGRLPAHQDEQAYLTAVLGLEQSRRTAGAVRAYHASLERWPDSLGGWMGLGNAYYTLKDLEKAEEAFRTAALRHPNSGAARNNLAHVLAEQGKCRAALETIEQAIALGGAQAPVFERTKESIRNRMQSSSTPLCRD